MDEKTLYAIIAGLVGAVGFFWVKDRNSIDTDISELVELIRGFTREVKKSNEDYKEAYRMCMEEIKHNSDNIERSSDRIEEISNHIKRLYNKNKENKEEIDKLKK